MKEKRSYLTRSEVDRLLAQLQYRPKNQLRNAILPARYIPRDAANVHLALGQTYNWTVIGIPAPEIEFERRAISPAQLQLLFQFVIRPELVNWLVRRLEPVPGISKSKASQAKRQMITEGLILHEGKQYRPASTKLFVDRLVVGYAQVLRPKLVAKRFCPPEKTMESFLARLSKGVRHSLSGGPAADLL